MCIRDSLFAILAFVALSRLTERFFLQHPMKDGHGLMQDKRFWTVLQWMATGFLWSQWLTQDLVNILVYLGDPAEVELWKFAFALTVLIGMLGYIFYQVGKFETAIKYFDKIPMESPYWLDGVFAAAWSEFRLVEVEPDDANRHYQRTLGYIHTLNAPFFYDYLYPEAIVLKAVTLSLIHI